MRLNSRSFAPSSQNPRKNRRKMRSASLFSPGAPRTLPANRSVLRHVARDLQEPAGWGQVEEEYGNRGQSLPGSPARPTRLFSGAAHGAHKAAALFLLLRTPSLAAMETHSGISENISPPTTQAKSGKNTDQKLQLSCPRTKVGFTRQ